MRIKQGRTERTWIVYNEHGIVLAVVSTLGRAIDVAAELARDLK